MLLTWFWTVLRLSVSAGAMSWLFLPQAMPSRISRSRRVSRGTRGCLGGGEEVQQGVAIAGLKIASPLEQC
jgi:hypothetical protein